MKQAIPYYRVSTDKQGASGLGLEAQRATVQQWAQQAGVTLVREFVEIESGRKPVRRQLSQAMGMAQRLDMVLVVAKLDRLSRDVDMIRRICSSDLQVVFCDFPQIPVGPAGRFMLTMLAAVAEFEAGLISQRTKAALQAAKARGVKLGCPNGAAALKRFHEGRAKPHDNSAGVAAACAARQARRDAESHDDLAADAA